MLIEEMRKNQENFEQGLATRKVESEQRRVDQITGLIQLMDRKMNFDRVLLRNSLCRQKGNATRRLQVVPFVVGKAPAGTALPRIITSADVHALTQDQTIQYLGGYRIAYPDDATDEDCYGLLVEALMLDL